MGMRVFFRRSGLGQASMDHLLIFFFILAFVILGVFFYWEYFVSSEADVSNVQVERFGRTVVSTAERFYYHGFPSRVLIQETLPGNVHSLAVVDDDGDSLLVIRMKSGEMRDVFIFPSEVKMLGDLGGEEVASPGVKNVRIFTSPEVGGNIPFVTVNMGDGSCEVPGSRIDHSACYEGKFCFNGVLMDFCSLCRSQLSGVDPCSPGMMCQPDETCGTAITPVSPPVVNPVCSPACTSAQCVAQDTPYCVPGLGGVCYTDSWSEHRDACLPLAHCTCGSGGTCEFGGGDLTDFNECLSINPPITHPFAPRHALAPSVLHKTHHIVCPGSEAYATLTHGQSTETHAFHSRIVLADPVERASLEAAI